MTAAMNSQAAYLALKNDGDDDSTLVGSRILGSDRSMEYSNGTSTVSIDGSSLASSLFAGDSYFQQDAVLPPDWTQEERGRQLAKTLLEKSSKQRKKTSLLQRAVRAFRRRKVVKVPKDDDNKLRLEECPTHEEEFSDGEITFESTDPWQDGTAWQGETKTTTHIALTQQADSSPPPRDLDEISDCTSDATSRADQVEVWLPSDASTSPTDEENDDDDTFNEHMIKGESPISIPSPRRHRNAVDQFFPDGLFVRNTAEQVVEQLQLGEAGMDALKCLDEATTRADKAFDPSGMNTNNPDVVPSLATIAGVSIPDYKTYVRQAVNSFRKNVLQMSDDLYDLLERRMAAKNLVISICRSRLLPFAVELYAIERLMTTQPCDVASI